MENSYFNAINAILTVQKMHKQLIDAHVRDIVIHRTQHRILMHLSIKGNLPSQKELAEHLGITPAGVTCALQKLENDGYLARHLAADNRYNEIVITDAGKDIVEKTKLIFSEVDKSMFADFDEEELDLFIKSLEKIKNTAEKELMKGKNNETLV